MKSWAVGAVPEAGAGGLLDVCCAGGPPPLEQDLKCRTVELESSGTLLPLGDFAQVILAWQLRQVLSVEAMLQPAVTISALLRYSRKLPATATLSDSLFFTCLGRQATLPLRPGGS